MVLPKPAEGVFHVPFDHLPAIRGCTPAGKGREELGPACSNPAPHPFTSSGNQPHFCYQKPGQPHC